MSLGSLVKTLNVAHSRSVNHSGICRASRSRPDHKWWPLEDHPRQSLRCNHPAEFATTGLWSPAAIQFYHAMGESLLGPTVPKTDHVSLAVGHLAMAGLPPSSPKTHQLSVRQEIDYILPLRTLFPHCYRRGKGDTFALPLDIVLRREAHQIHVDHVLVVMLDLLVMPLAVAVGRPVVAVGRLGCQPMPERNGVSGCGCVGIQSPDPNVYSPTPL